MDNNSENNQQKVQNEINNENNIHNAVKIARATGHPIVGAVIDKAGHGKATRKLAEKFNTASRIVPGGYAAQRLLNRRSERATSDVSENENSSASNNNNDNTSSNEQYNEHVDDTSLESSKNDGKVEYNKNVFSKRKSRIIIFLIAFFSVSCIFICVIVAPLMALGIIDIGDFDITQSGSSESNSGSNYVAISNNVEYWWPLGSSQIDRNGYASGEPISCMITSYFGYRSDPYTGQTSYHSGIDLAPSGGSYGYGEVNVIAAKSGTVTLALNDPNCESNANNESCNGSGYGNYVMIQHGDGIITLYGHLHKNTITVKEGDIVNQGQVIAKMGSSGRSTGMHLHFEVRENGTAVDPLNFVSSDNARPISKSVNNKEDNEGEQNEVS